MVRQDAEAQLQAIDEQHDGKAADDDDKSHGKGDSSFRDSMATHQKRITYAETQQYNRKCNNVWRRSRYTPQTRAASHRENFANWRFQYSL